MRRLRLGLDNTSLVGHQDGVDDVDDTVGLEDIGCGDGGCAAFGVGEDDVAAGHGGGEVFTLNGLKSGFAAALFDHGCELPGADAASNDMVGKDLDEGIFVFRLDECFDCAGGELAKASSVGAKTVKGPGLLRVSTKPPALTAATRVLWIGELTAFSTMVLVGYISAPPTVGSFCA